MMRFMTSCMLAEGPAPSVETPLHSLLPHRVIAHTHDVATMSLTNVGDGTAERLLGELFDGAIVYVPYTRPGFPLARSVREMVERIPAGAIGLALAHHGLVVWGDDARECHDRLTQGVTRMDQYLATARRGRRLLGETRGSVPPPEQRKRLAEVVLPVLRGALGRPDRVVLHFDDGDDLMETLAAERTAELSRRGMATPEHLLRAGRLPVWLDLDLAAPEDRLAGQVRSRLAAARAEYEKYHGRNAAAGERPLDDWAKVVLAPGLGMITASSDKRGRDDGQPLLSRGAGDHRERRGGGPVRVPRRAGRVRVRALAAGAPEGGRADRQGSRYQATAPARGRSDRRGQRDRPERRAPLRRGGCPRRGGGSGRRGGGGRGVGGCGALSRARARRRRGRPRRRESRRPLPPRGARVRRGGLACFTLPARRRASRPSPRSGGRTCSDSSRSTTSGRLPRSAGQRW